MSTRHANARRAVVWAGAACTLVIAALWAASERWWAHLDGREWKCALTRGALVIARETQPVFSVPPGWYSGRVEGWENRSWWFSRWRGNGRVSQSIPLWCCLAGVLVPTALAWRYDRACRRRERKKMCLTCGYSRSGLDPGTPCPECGANPRSRT